MPSPGRRSSTSSRFCFSACTWPRRVGTGIVAPRVDRPTRDLRRADGRDRLEPDHLVFRASRHQSSHALIGGLVGAGHRPRAAWRRSSGTACQDDRRDRAVAADRLPAGAAADPGRCPGSSCVDAVCASTDCSARCSSSPPRSIRLGMAATTRRRPWASSPCCSTRRASRRRILRAVLGRDHLPGGHGAGHADRRLAHRARPWARRSRG